MTLTNGPGSGKTRLLSEVMQYCDSQGSTTLQDKLKLEETVQKVMPLGCLSCTGHCGQPNPYIPDNTSLVPFFPG